MHCLHVYNFSWKKERVNLWPCTTVRNCQLWSHIMIYLLNYDLINVVLSVAIQLMNEMKDLQQTFTSVHFFFFFFFFCYKWILSFESSMGSIYSQAKVGSSILFEIHLLVHSSFCDQLLLVLFQSTASFFLRLVLPAVSYVKSGQRTTFFLKHQGVLYHTR